MIAETKAGPTVEERLANLEACVGQLAMAVSRHAAIPSGEEYDDVRAAHVREVERIMAIRAARQ